MTPQLRAAHTSNGCFTISASGPADSDAATISGTMTPYLNHGQEPPQVHFKGSIHYTKVLNLATTETRITHAVAGNHHDLLAEFQKVVDRYYAPTTSASS